MLIQTAVSAAVRSALIGTDTFARIQQAISAVNNGGTIVVMAGIYNENIIINKPLTLRGPNYGIDPNQTARQPEAQIYPATGNVTTALNSRVITIASSDVSINGFLIDGDNAELQSNIVGTNNADIDARTGIENSVAVNNLSVTNTIIQNVLFAGVRLQNTAGFSPAVTNGHVIQGNLIRDLGTYQAAGGFERNGTGIVLQNTHYASIANNLIENARIGVQVNNFRFVNPASTSYGIDENTISARAVGVLLNGHLVAPWQITNNTISARNSENEMNLGTVWRGIQVLNMTAGIGSTKLTANDIDGTGLELIASEGVTVWNVPESAAVEISGGSISNTSIGVNVNNFDGNNFSASRGSYATIQNVTIAAHSTGVRIHDGTRSSHATVSATFGDGVMFQGVAQGLSIENASAQVPVLGNVAFAGQLENYIRLINNTSTLDATAVSFDGVASPTASIANFYAIEDKIAHKQDDSALGMVRVTAGTLYTTASGSIQRSINNAINGEIIHVQAGTYPEILVIDKTVQLLGANAGIVGSATSRGAESIIVPATDDADNNVLVTLAASDVTVDGFTLDGDNPALPSNGLGFNGADHHASEGVASSSDNVNRTTIPNNIITNVAFAAVDLFGVSGNVAKTGHAVRANLIKDLGHYSAIATSSANWGIGVLLYNSNYAAVSDNTFENVRIGIQTGNYQTANTGDAAFQVISGNTIAARSKGIFYNLHNYSPWTVNDNDITGVTSSDEVELPSATNSARGYWTGILVASQGASAPSTISDNDINGSAISGIPTAGITVWNVKASAAAMVSGGSITGVQTGIELNNYEGYRNDATHGAHATLSDVTIAATQTGIDVRDSDASTLHAAVALTLGTGVTMTVGPTVSW